MRIAFIFAYAAVVLLIGISRGESSISGFFDLKESEKKLEATVEGLRQENKNLMDEIEKIEKSKGYAQKVLRDRYHVTQENEHILFFSDD